LDKDFSGTSTRESFGRSRNNRRNEQSQKRQSRAKSQGPEQAAQRQKSMSREESNKLQSFRQRNSHQPNNNSQPQNNHKFERQVSDNSRSSNFRSDAPHHMTQQQKTPKLQQRHSQKKDINSNIQNTKNLPKEHKHVPSQQWGEDLRLPRGQDFAEVMMLDDRRFQDNHDHRGQKKKKIQNDRRKSQNERYEPKDSNYDREVTFKHKKKPHEDVASNGDHNNNRKAADNRSRRPAREIVMYQPPHRRSDA